MENELKMVYRIDTHGGLSGGFALEIRLRYPRELTREDDWNLSQCAEKLIEQLQTETFRTDPKYVQAKREWLDKARAIFKDGGFDPIFIEEIPNEYWGQSWVHEPWLIVTTTVGHFKVGWRKRVIHLEWTKTLITASAEALFLEEKVTMSAGEKERWIHCWGYDKAVEYLRCLRKFVPAP